MTVYGAFAAPFSFSLASFKRQGTDFRSLHQEGISYADRHRKIFRQRQGYGFITNEAGGNDAFVHMTAVAAAGMRTLEKEQRISYELENDKRGKTSAVNLQAA